MFTRPHSSAIRTVLLCCLALFAVTALADDDVHYLTIQPPTGSNIPLKVAHAPVPFNKSYKRLSKAEKLAFRELYQGLPEDVVPPYPRVGLRGLYLPLARVDSEIFQQGELFIIAKIDEDGEMTSISVFDSPNETISKLVLAQLQDTEFTPATCAGKPCAMEFPIIQSPFRIKKWNYPSNQ